MMSTSGDAVMRTPFNDGTTFITRSTYIFAICSAVNSISLGYDIGVSTNVGSMVQDDFDLSTIQREVFLGSLNFWSIFGSLLAHGICDRYGRRRAFVVAAISFIIGVIIMSAAQSYGVLLFGRVFVGLGVGFGLAIDPLYISEISPAEHRGELVTYSEISTNIGICLGFASGLILYDIRDDVQWRIMLLMGGIMPIVMIILVRTVMPESPRWLVGQGHEDEAKLILQRVYPPDSDVDSVVGDIKKSIIRENEAHNLVGWSAILFPTMAVRRMLMIGVGTAVAQQATGIDAIQYYLIDVLEEAGIDSARRRLAVLVVLGLLKLLFVVIGGKLFDRKGRRPLFFISLIGMAISLLAISFTFIGKDNPGVAVAGLAFYLAFFSIGLGPGAWLIPSEVFPTSIRAKSMGVATFFNRITATIMSSTFLSTANGIGWGGFFVLLSVICVIVCVFFFFYLPETAGRSLDDMALYFAELTGDQSILEVESKLESSGSSSQVEMGATRTKTPEGTMT